MKLTQRSIDRMKGVHGKLVSVVLRAAELSDLEFTVTCGLRTLAEQKVLLAKGATKTLNSKHLTGHAVDVAPVVDGQVRWDWPLFHILAKTFKAAAKELGVEIAWGGDWKGFPDGPHFEINPRKYPL